ncbi:OBSCN protein, partial [Odontophorus gujanensis]|nr:OBSCN protein [Odontophorus gujanensis]
SRKETVICKLECVQCPFSEMPVLFKQELQNKEAKEGKQVKLTCELSKPDTPVKWMKGNTVLHASEKYEFKQHGTVAELIIRDVTAIDA